MALLISVAIGGAIGFTSSFSSGAEDYPTNEMLSRGEPMGLVTGICIAIPSGMGVALSILGNNTASLVGVAISASLLPPAVNSGICWAHAVLIRAGAVSYANTADFNFAQIGGISFLLTVVNIVCIWIAGMGMFAIKEGEFIVLIVYQNSTSCKCTMFSPSSHPSVQQSRSYQSQVGLLGQRYQGSSSPKAGFKEERRCGGNPQGFVRCS